MSHDTTIHRIVRPVVRRIAPTGITPNQLTTLRLVTGLIAAVAFAAGGEAWPRLGGVIFLLSLLLDRADGELARQTGRCSAMGYRYDLVCDCLATVATFIGIGFGLVDSFGPAAILLGLIAGAGVCGLFWMLNVLKVAPVSTYRFWGDRIVIDTDDAMALVPVLIWCGAAKLELVAAASLTLVALLGLSLRGFLKRTGTAAAAEQQIDGVSLPD